MNHPVETFGFRIEHAGQVLAYSADTGPCGELVRLASGADVLLSEASFIDGPDLPPDLHLTARQAAEHAVRADVGELVLTHLVAWNDPAVSREQAAEVVQRPAPAGQLRGSGCSAARRTDTQQRDCARARTRKCPGRNQLRTRSWYLRRSWP